MSTFLRPDQLSSIFLNSILAAILLTTLTLQADEVGLAVGEMAPDFAMKDQTGDVIKLSELTAKHGKVALAFFR